MKFVYLDESGTGGEPIAVMAGVITDTAEYIYNFVPESLK